MDKHALQEFMNAQPVAVISTVTPEGQPEAAVIGFACTAELELIFYTRLTTRKHHNFTANPHAAFVIGWQDLVTVQYEGVVSQLEGARLADAKAFYLQKNPFAKKFEAEPQVAFFQATPQWIRQTDIKQQPWNIQEWTLS